MKAKHIQKVLASLFLISFFWLTGCQTGNAPANTAVNRNLPPERVDIRGSIFASRYNEGQVVLEVEGTPGQLNTRYDRAYVLVLPTAQLIGPEGRAISVSELRQGQNVSILLRGGGQGNRVGVGVARKLWVQDAF